MAEPSQNRTNWYVLQVLSGSEHIVRDSFTKLVDETLYELCFVPLMETLYKKGGRYAKLDKPLFPGYLFIVSDHIDEVHLALNKITRFNRILTTSSDFEALLEEEVRVFKEFTDKAFNVNLSKGIIEGDQIKVSEGPLEGHEGKIKKIDRHKRMALVELPFLGQATIVRMPLEIVRKEK